LKVAGEGSVTELIVLGFGGFSSIAPWDWPIRRALALNLAAKCPAMTPASDKTPCNLEVDNHDGNDGVVNIPFSQLD
jgi:hypothetical protein